MEGKWWYTVFLALCKVSKPSKLPLRCQEGRQMLINSYLKFYLYWLPYGRIQFCPPSLLPQLPSDKGERCCRRGLHSR